MPLGVSTLLGVQLSLEHPSRLEEIVTMSTHPLHMLSGAGAGGPRTCARHGP